MPLFCRRQKTTQDGESAAAAAATNPSDFSSGSNSSTQTVSGLHSHEADAAAASGLDVECAMTERLQHLESTWESALRETVFDEEARDAILSFHCSARRRPPRMQAAINREIFTRHLGRIARGVGRVFTTYSSYFASEVVAVKQNCGYGLTGLPVTNRPARSAQRAALK